MAPPTTAASVCAARLPRRSRKMLVMEDGHTVNLALWLDPSVHYWAPIERMESLEVIRGTVITHGPNNNFGVINSRNLSPFGPDETVVSSAIGFTKTRRARTSLIDEIESMTPGGWRSSLRRRLHGKSDTDISSRWHVHTRQHVENVGLVAVVHRRRRSGRVGYRAPALPRLLRRAGLEGRRRRPRRSRRSMPASGTITTSRISSARSMVM